MFERWVQVHLDASTRYIRVVGVDEVTFAEVPLPACMSRDRSVPWSSLLSLAGLQDAPSLHHVF